MLSSLSYCVVVICIPLWSHGSSKSFKAEPTLAWGPQTPFGPVQRIDVSTSSALESETDQDNASCKSIKHPRHVPEPRTGSSSYSKSSRPGRVRVQDLAASNASRDPDTLSLHTVMVRPDLLNDNGGWASDDADSSSLASMNVPSTGKDGLEQINLLDYSSGYSRSKLSSPPSAPSPQQRGNGVRRASRIKCVVKGGEDESLKDTSLDFLPPSTM